MNAALFRLVDGVRTIGLPRALWMAPVWVIRERYLVATRSLEGPLPTVALPADLGGLRDMALEPQDVPLLAALHPAMSATEVERRLREGWECRLGWLEGRLVHFRWDAARPIYLTYLRRTIRLFPGDVLSSLAYTCPSARERGVHVALHTAALRRARERGAKRSLMLWASWNVPAARVAERAGRRVVGTIGCWRLGVARFPTASGAVRLEGENTFSVAL